MLVEGIPISGKSREYRRHPGSLRHPPEGPPDPLPADLKVPRPVKVKAVAKAAIAAAIQITYP